MGHYTRLTDAALIREASEDQQAFRELYDRHAPDLYRWARRTGLAEADALDLVSELFARAWISRKRYRDPGDGAAAPWLHGIARNLAASKRRSGSIEARARKRLGMPIAVQPDATDVLDERVDARASRPELERALEALPQRQREAVRLRIVDGLEYPDIALQLSCTETTARKWVSLGLRCLRNRMETAR
jgi:RNA polymerase sigma-70 factor (ECF subfamily)